MCGSVVVSALDCQQRDRWFKSLTGWKSVEISAPPLTPSQLSYNESTMSVGWSDGEGEDWLPAVVC